MSEPDLDEVMQQIADFKAELEQRNPKVVLPGDHERMDILFVQLAKLVGAKEVIN